MKKLILACLVAFSTASIAADRCAGTALDTRCDPSTEVRVLMYHRVTDDVEAADWSIRQDTLAQHLDMIRKLGYSTVTASELTEFMQGKIRLPKKSVAITFDDGWKDNLNAVRMLEERNMSATFYILSGAFSTPLYLSKEDVVYISQNKNFEIGAHSHTHFMEWVGKMDTVDDRIIVGEMLMSKAILEKVIQKPVLSFAWPFGYFRQSALNKVSAIGFTSTVHVNGETKNARGSDPIHITRINVSGMCNADQLKTMLETGKYQTVSNLW